MIDTDDVALLELHTSCGFIDFCICVFVENAFAFSWQFLLRFRTMTFTTCNMYWAPCQLRDLKNF